MASETKKCKCANGHTYTAPLNVDCYKFCTNIGDTGGEDGGRISRGGECECADKNVYASPPGVSCYRFCNDIAISNKKRPESKTYSTEASVGSLKLSTSKSIGLRGDYSDISERGERRLYRVVGDMGGKYSFYVKNSSGEYYNFKKREFGSEYLKEDGELAGDKVIKVLFPNITSNDTYNIFLIAGENTMHEKENKYYFGDGTVDLNLSVGSDSKVVEKVINQNLDTTLTFAAITPNSLSEWSGYNITSSELIVGADMIGSAMSFTIVIENMATKTITINKIPDTSDLMYTVNRVIGSLVNLPNKLIQSKVWELDDINGLHEDMLVSGTNIMIGTLTRKFIFKDIEIPAIDPLGFKPIISNGVVVSQQGNIALDRDQPAILGVEPIKLYTWGRKNIHKLTGFDVELNDVKLTLDPVTTLTTSPVSSNVVVPVASVEGIEEGVSEVSGIGIDPSVAPPKVASISGNNLTLSASQTIESGQLLGFSGASRKITITGNITVYSIPTTGITINLDIERFLTATVQ
jgi:hypothetical protein